MACMRNPRHNGFTNFRELYLSGRKLPLHALEGAGDTRNRALPEAPVRRPYAVTKEIDGAPRPLSYGEYLRFGVGL